MFNSFDSVSSSKGWKKDDQPDDKSYYELYSNESLSIRRNIFFIIHNVLKRLIRRFIK